MTDWRGVRGGGWAEWPAAGSPSAGLVVEAAVRVMVSGFPRVGGNSTSGMAAMVGGEPIVGHYGPSTKSSSRLPVTRIAPNRTRWVRVWFLTCGDLKLKSVMPALGCPIVGRPSPTQ